MTAASIPTEGVEAANPKGAERQAILDAARAPIKAKLGLAVRFKPYRFERRGDWAFLHAAMQDARGRAILYRGTDLADAERMGVVSKDYAALLRLANGRWTVVDYAIGPSDVAWEGWATEHGAPEALFQ